MKLRTVLAAAFAAVLSCQNAFGAATLLPNGQQCFQAVAGTTGMVGLLGTITGGSGGTAGTYGGVALTGGTGTGATANITVAGGVVTAVSILNPGSAYVVGDVLSAAAANIGNTTGFSVPVSSVAINTSLAGGLVYFYVPNTSTFKSTWFNADQSSSHQNTNPVTLDANGCAVIYGIGSYRQVLKDALGNTVWDQITTDTSANNNTFWAGVSGGTPNVITVVDPGFNATDGSIINFTAVATNTGAATLNPSGFGAIPILKNTTGGPVSLTGGEIVQTNQISVIYSSVANSFNLLNTAIPSAAGTSAPLCGATGLKIINNAVTPNSIINLTADQIVMQSPTGLTINRSNVSLTAINITLGTATATANGMDGETPTTNQVLYIWAIDNGAAPAGLVSTSSSAPTMPSGYNYKCRLGAMLTGNPVALLRTIQLGNRGQFVLTAASQTLTFNLVSSGVAGTSCGSATPVYATVSVTGTIPTTATAGDFILFNKYNNAAQSNVSLAPNGVAGGYGSTNPPFAGVSTTAQLMMHANMVFETPSQVAWCSDGSGGALFVSGWTDKVNAN